MNSQTLCRASETRKVGAVASQASIKGDIEQRRRLLDKQGEEQRKFIANKTSQLLKFTPYELKHVPWPVESTIPVSDSVFQEAYNAAEGGWHAVENVLHKASLLANNTFNATADAVSSLTLKATQLAENTFNKTADLVTSVGEKTANVASAVGEASAHAATAVGQATIGVASSIGHKAYEAVDVAAGLAQNVGYKTAEVASIAGHKAVEVGSIYGTKAVEVGTIYGHKAVDVASDVVAAVTPLAADIANEAKSRLVHLKDEVVYSTTRKYIKALMETERRRRMIDFDQQYAILNALRASSLIKGLGCEFYRQSCDKFTYSFILLEEIERTWRQLPNHSLVATANARQCAILIKNKFTPIVIPAAKIEMVEPPTIRKAYTPAL